MSEAFPEPEVLEERLLELREREAHPLPDGVDEADALDQLRGLDDPDTSSLAPRIVDGVDEADAIDQARTVSFDEEDDYRG
jgi:hypothetical protein